MLSVILWGSYQKPKMQTWAVSTKNTAQKWETLPIAGTKGTWAQNINVLEAKTIILLKPAKHFSSIRYFVHYGKTQPGEAKVLSSRSKRLHST